MSKTDMPISNKVEKIKPSHSGVIVNPFLLTSIIWVVLILLALLTILSAYIVTKRIIDGDNLLEGISNFSTLLSIILSISSISFAYYTSHQTSRQYENMSTAVTEIKESNRHMEKNNAMLLRFIREITKEIGIIGGMMDKPSNSQKVEEKYTNENIPSNSSK